MAYTPDPTNPNQPTDAIIAETSQAEFRALKAYLQSLIGGPLTGPLPLRGYIAGLVLSNDAGTPNTIFDIAVGEATDDTNLVRIILPIAFTKTTADFVAGTGNGALDTGAIAMSTWYHVYLIQNAAASLQDILLSLSATAPTMPTGYTVKRRIGSLLTDGSAHLVAFTQFGDEFKWKVPPAVEFSTANPGTAAVAVTLGQIPTGVVLEHIANWSISQSTSGGETLLYISDPATTDEAPSLTATPLGTVGPVETVSGLAGNIMSIVRTRTNTAAQVRYRCLFSDGNTIVKCTTLGWIDSRGKNA